jgi:hypothetical protein
MDTEPKQKTDELPKDTSEDYKSRQQGIENLSRVQGDGAFVALSPSDTGVGRIIDISMGGLMFEYVTVKEPSIEAKEPSIEPTELEIFVPGAEFRLGGLPCKSIWDRPSSEVFNTPLHKRRCGVQFGELKQSQIAQLEYFIQNHVTDET